MNNAAVPVDREQWAEIFRTLANNPAADVPLVLPFNAQVRDGHFTAALVRMKGRWPRSVIVVFPYRNAAWIAYARTVLQFEAQCWTRWAALQEGLAADGHPPTWWDAPLVNGGVAVLRDVTMSTDEEPLVVPVLVRPYIAFPTLRERPLPAATYATAAGELRRVAEWVMSNRDVTEYFSPRRRLLGPRDVARFQWPGILDDYESLMSDASGKTTPPITGHHLLSDGQSLIPTRWRPFHARYATFGSADGQR